MKYTGGAAIAQWIRLGLPSCRPGSSPKYSIYAFYSKILYSNCHCVEKRTKINNKKLGLAHFLRKYRDTDKIMKFVSAKV